MNNTLIRLFFMLSICSGLSGLTGCVQTTTHWDAQFGDSLRLAASRQTLDSGAGQKDTPESMDGGASREAIGRYRDSFREPPQSNPQFFMGIGR